MSKVRNFEWCAWTYSEEVEKPLPPARKTAKSAGYDFHMPYDLVLLPGESAIIPTHYRVQLYDNEWLALFIRSSLAMKKGIRLVNHVGVIDADYYDNPNNGGEIMVGITNDSSEPVELKKDEAFMQGVILPYSVTDDDDVQTQRVGGIGSTSAR